MRAAVSSVTTFPYTMNYINKNKTLGVPGSHVQNDKAVEKRDFRFVSFAIW
jgi:hypothetical protein